MNKVLKLTAKRDKVGFKHLKREFKTIAIMRKITWSQ